MFSILLDIWGHVKSLKPAFLSRHPHFNFITVHYFWIIGVIIVGSICLYPRSNLDYIDALFQASGAATQSGLNTVDINLLNTWQQTAILICTFVCTPISINTYVVFLRLYWFERRFQEVVKLAKKGRRSIAKSFSKAKEDKDPGNAEKGVQGRSIVVMHETTGSHSQPKSNSNSNSLHGDEDANTAAAVKNLGNPRLSIDSIDTRKADSSDSHEEPLHPIEKTTTHTPQIKFADQVKRSNGMTDDDLRLPALRSQEEHIAVLQRQRNPDSSSILRIPGPRDADAGITPHYVDEADANLSRMLSGRTSAVPSRRGSDSSEIEDQVLEEPVQRNITIQEPEPRPDIEHLTQDASRTHQPVPSPYIRHRLNGASSVGGKTPNLDADGFRGRKRAGTFNSIRRALTSSKSDYGTPYLSWEPTVGRNSEFTDLTEDQREELGGIEYRSLKTLALILVIYVFGFLLLGIVGLVPWILGSKTYGPTVQEIGQGRPWWGVFTATSAFTDLGFTLTPDSMVSFGTATWPLLLMSFLIIIGNTGFPIMLRIIIWTTSKSVPMFSGIFEELRFLLDHPRRCFTLLFPSKATWWLFWILVILNGMDLIFFIILDLHNTAVSALPVHTRVLDGWFQAVSTRTAGFAVVNLALLHPGIQVSYLIMMYISILPIAISVRRTNVYEEKSLGIYGSASEEHDDEAEPSYVGAHIRRQLSFDLWYIFLGFFIISIAEGTKIQNDENFTMFSILFEIVSAYGTVGLSLGYNGTDTSLSAQFGIVSKLVIIAMQIRGRHRGLPYELDRAILLPSEHLHQQEIEAARQAAAFRRSNTMLGITGISSGATKTAPTRGRSRDNYKAFNVLGSVFHAGPPLPDNVRIDPTVTRRRHSIAIADLRGTRTRSDSITSTSANLGNFGVPIGDATNSERTTTRRSGSRFSGRRNFVQDGNNSTVREAANET